ncbi:MAG: hypothetical protein NUW01_17455 [Gemmatimonadaceae bacterium]|nr:hypothetical protein [Gemmatimonadaceae bacterium]
MREPDEIDGEAEGTVFRDMLMLALLGFVAIAILLLPHVNPKGTTAQADIKPPGNVVIEVRWPDGIDADVDLWTKAPGDIPVGYSNKGGLIFNLLRDDLGSQADPTDLNYEVSYSRGIPPGEYVVNLHLYSNTAGVFPIAVKVNASVKAKPEDSMVPIAETRVDLRQPGEERTAMRFKLDAKGALVPGSVHNLPMPLRSGGKP